MYRRRRRPKESLQVGLRGCSAIHRHVAVDECQVLALLLCESVWHRILN